MRSCSPVHTCSKPFEQVNLMRYNQISQPVHLFMENHRKNEKADCHSGLENSLWLLLFREQVNRSG